jgi:hypothetical protein
MELNTSRRQQKEHAMGDRGGKKDKEKSQKQSNKKQDQKQKKIQDKQPKRNA